MLRLGLLSRRSLSTKVAPTQQLNQLPGFEPTRLVQSAHAAGSTRPVYLDVQATTPMDPRVLDAMLPYFLERYGNPHSRTHAYGWEAEKAVEEGRRRVADLIGADPKEVCCMSARLFVFYLNILSQYVTIFYLDI